MIKSPRRSQYEAPSFRVKPVTTNPAPASPTATPSDVVGGNAGDQNDRDTGGISKSIHRLFRPQGADEPSRSSTGASDDRFTALVPPPDSETTIAVLSKPNWAAKDINHMSLSGTTAGKDELNMSGAGSDNMSFQPNNALSSASFRSNNSQSSSMRMMRLMSRSDLLDLDPQESDPQGNQGVSELKVNVPSKFSSPRHQRLISPSSFNRMSSPPRPPHSPSNLFPPHSPREQPSSPSRRGLHLNLDELNLGDPFITPLSSPRFDSLL